MGLQRRKVITGLALATAGLAVVGVGWRAGPADANGAAAAQHIQNLSQQAIGTLARRDLTLAQREAALAQIFDQGFDIDLIGRIVLGKAWRRATPEQQRDYLALFSLYVVRTFANRLAGYAGETVVVVGTRDAGKKDIYVDSRINRPSSTPVAAAWRVREINGQPRVIDVVVEGVSLALTQRDDFAAVVKKNGVAGLLEVLRAKTQRLSAQSG